MPQRICQTCNAYQVRTVSWGKEGVCARVGPPFFLIAYDYWCKRWGLDEAYSRCPKPVEKL